MAGYAADITVFAAVTRPATSVTFWLRAPAELTTNRAADWSHLPFDTLRIISPNGRVGAC